MIYLKLSAKVIMNSYKNVYILGIGGTGMSSIAKYMSQAGFNVGGYDQRKSYITNTLEQESINIDFDLEEITYDKDTLYIYSTAFNLTKTNLSSNTESKNVLSRPEFLQELTRDNYVIGVTGTHGKTSTTALLAHIFHYNKRNVSYIFGGVTSFNGIGGHYGSDNKVLILEADEAFDTFNSLHIDDLLVTNIDEDHLDYYLNFENLINAFKNVIENTSNNVVLNLDNLELKKLKLSKKIYSYSSSDESEITIINSGVISHEGTNFQIETSMIGDHFKSNIAGAICIAYLNGISIEDSLLAIKHFSGVRRRAEFLGSTSGISIYDDYGHHPTEIDATITALKSHVKGKLYVVFQPHRYTRTQEHLDKFKMSLLKADETIVVDIYPSQ
jgi:UDP-N-acetylmuramate--alanine ligase